MGGAGGGRGGVSGASGFTLCLKEYFEERAGSEGLLAFSVAFSSDFLCGLLVCDLLVSADWDFGGLPLFPKDSYFLDSPLA